MFYSQFILAKKGPLGTIWIAAHLERKLRKNQVADTDIGVSVDSILFPDVPIALRLSSHLLLGVVRIYSRKVGYLFDDCSDALLKVKQAFRSAAVDLPPEESTAPYHSITLPETFDLDDFELPDTTDLRNYVDHHVSSREQITLQDTMEGVVFSTSQFGLDERFGDGDTSGMELEELDNLGREADAQAPRTPGLAEEPNLSTAQGASVCDDQHDLEEPNFSNIHVGLECEGHQGSEDGDLTKLSTEENLTRVTSNSDFYSGKENGESGSLPNDATPAVLDGQNIDNINSLAYVSSPAWTPFPEDQVEAMSPACEHPGGNSTLLDGVNGLPNGVTNSEDQGLTGKLTPKTIEIDQSSVELQVSHSVVDVENMENSCHLGNSVPFNGESTSRNCSENYEIQTSEHQNDPKVTSFIIHEKLGVGDTHILQPCKNLNQSRETIPGSDVEAHAPDTSMDVQELPLVDDNQLEVGKLNDQDDNVPSMEPQLEKSIENVMSELPAPEKLRSVPEYLEDDQVHLLESTPNTEHLVNEDPNDIGTNMVSRKKRSFTESTLTVDSLNSFESLGVVQSKRTKESVPDDNDLLSSILVGRYSALKLKATPPPEKTSRKRPRTTSRITSSSKRKVSVDATMVLHGDQIRQQLTNTADIRRIRKKAPCTRAEIWMIRKEYLDEDIFTESIFTGFSSDLASMYIHTYDLSDIKLIHNETQSEIQGAICHDMPLHADINLAKETEKEVNQESNLTKNDMDVQSPETQQDKTSPQSLPNVHSGVTSDMHINGEITSTADVINPLIANGVESAFPNDSVSVDKVDVPTGSVDLSNGVQSNTADMHDHTLENHIVEMEALNVDASSVKVVEEAICGMESQAGNEFPLEGTEAGVTVTDGANGLTTDDLQDRVLVTSPDEALEAIRKNDLEVVNEIENVEFYVEGINPVACDLGREPAEALIDHVEVPISDLKGASLSDGEHFGCKSLNLQNETDPENAFVHCNPETDYSDLKYNVDGHDTGFLNDEDDEILEDGEDCAPSTEQIGSIDNSGWSSRTRAVAKYLQVLFDKETEQGTKALPMNNLLVGKTRKEASRMFFEALVLKTRDYIHVEQEAPFKNINMKPRGNLMKSDFC